MIPFAELRALHRLIGRNIAGDLPFPGNPAAGRPTASAGGITTPVLLAAVELHEEALAADRAPETDGFTASEPVATSLAGLRAPRPPDAAVARAFGQLAAALVSKVSGPAERGYAARADLPGLTYAPSAADYGAEGPQNVPDPSGKSFRAAQAPEATLENPSHRPVPVTRAGQFGPAPGDRTMLAGAQALRVDHASADVSDSTGFSRPPSPLGGDREVKRAVLSALGFSSPSTGADAGLLAELPFTDVEQAGIIASFVLNAAVIPGWPPPRPLESARAAEMAQLLAVLTPEEREVAEELSRLLKNPALIERLLRRLLPEQRRLRLMAALALMVKRFATVLELLAEWGEDALEPAGPAPRERLVLR